MTIRTLIILVLFVAAKTHGLAASIRWEVADGGNGHYYEYLPVQLRWAEARAAAKDRNFNGLEGHLVNITSRSENAFVASILPPDVFSVWLGANDLGVEGHWIWADGPEAGDPIGPFDAWNTNEPNNQNNEDVGVFPGLSVSGGPGSLGKWYDGSANWHNAMVVEYSIEHPAPGSDNSGSGDGMLTITMQPENLVVEAAGSARFEVVASGPSPLSFQWYFGDDPIPDADSRIVQFFDVPFEQNGDYWASVTDADGNTRISERATLTVIDPVAERQDVIADIVNSRWVRGLHGSAIHFTPPLGNQKNGQNGIALSAGEDWASTGTLWDVEWRREDAGLQLIHPFGSGQCIISIQENSVGLSTPQSWIEVGYGPGIRTSLLFSPAFNQNFPLLDNFPYRIKTQVSPDGSVSVYVNRQLVASGTVSNTHPIDFKIADGEFFPSGPLNGGGAFEGEDFPVVWPKGTAGLILEPAESRNSEVRSVQFAARPAPLPIISRQPEDRSVDFGQSTTLAVEATAEGPIAYQWFVDGVAISGATGSTLRIPNIQVHQSGEYFVTLKTASIKTVKSRNVTVSVSPPEPPSIILQPVSVTVDRGMSARFLAAVAGAAPLSLQWYFEGEAVPGATSPLLQLDAVSSENDGRYVLRLENSVGEFAESDPVFLKVIVPQPPVIQQSLSDRIGDWGSTVGFQVRAEGTAPLHFEWLFNGRGLKEGTASTLELIDVTSDDAGEYTVVVSNRTGQQASSTATLFVEPPAPPTIVSGPANVTVIEGGQAEFSVEVVGVGLLEFQWYFVGSPIWGATSSNLILSNVTAEQAGLYLVLVNGPSGESVISESASLTVRPPETPALVSEPQDVSAIVDEKVEFVVEATGSSPLRFQWMYNDGAIAGATTERLILNQVKVRDSGRYWVTVSNAHGQVTSRQASLAVVDPFQPPSNDAFEGRLPITGSDVELSTDNVNATSQVGEPSHGDFSGNQSLWWTWTAMQAAEVTVETAGSQIDTQLAVYIGDSLTQLILVDRNDDFPGAGTSSKVTFNAREGQSFQIAVDTFGNQSGDIRLLLHSIPILPRIRISRSGGNIVLTWTPSGDSYVVETTSSLISRDWKEVDIPVATVEESLAVKIPSTELKGFFRLRSSP